jgi:tetratricopeptide (TPR) repeat protein
VRAGATLAAAVLPFACGAAYAQLLDFPAIEAMIKRGDAAAAYALLDPHEFNYAGDADYDYLFGLAALETGHVDRAKAALERLLLTNPDLPGARVSLGRAYVALGEKARARREFELVLGANPPQATRDLVAGYLRTLDADMGVPNPTRGAGYVEASVGRDSNIDLATGQDQIFVPLFGINFAVPSTSVAIAENYLGFGGGAAIEHDFDDRFSGFAAATAKLQDNAHVAAYNIQEYEARAGVQYAEGATIARLGLVGDRYYLGGQDYRSIDGVLGEWRIQAGARDQASVFAQDSRIRYLQADIASFSGDQALAGAGWLRSFDDAGRRYAFAGVFGGRDRATDHREDGDKAIYGARVAGQWTLGERAEVFAYASAASGRYDQPNPNFLVERRDLQYDAGIGVNWRVAPGWSLRPQLSYTRNDSNIELYGYNRYDLSITLRRDIR